ncbi:MAG: DUF2141 domain-containing protein [Desulfatiglandaceae bacterium]
MKQKWMILFVLLFLASPISYAQEKFTISGEVFIAEEGKLFIELHNSQDTWRAMIRPPIFQAIEPNDEQKKASKVLFKFEGVPAGTYAIRAWLDANRNGDLDRTETGYPKEPVGVHRFFAGKWSWDRVKFDLNQDLSGLIIAMGRW